MLADCNMDITALKSTLVNKINEFSNQEILEELNALVDEMRQPESLDFWNGLTPIQKKSVALSRKQIEEVKVIPNEQVQQEVKQWLRK